MEVKKEKSKLGKLLAVIKNWGWVLPVLLVAFILRWHNYAQFPVVGETQDEVAWTYLGSSLIADQVPTSWSYFESYGEEHIYQQSLRPIKESEREAPLVRPALDHPPFFALLPGFAHWLSTQLNHQSWLEFPAATVFRAPLVLLGTLNVLLLAWVANYIFADKKWSFLTTLIYAIWPTIVFSSRLVVAENLIITWELLALGLVLSKLYKKQWGWWGLVLVGAAAILSKVSGLILPVTILAYGLLAKNPKISLAGITGLLLGVTLFVAYGAVYDWQLFWSIFADQSGRSLGLATFHNRFLLHPALLDKFYFDGVVIAGLFATAVTMALNLGKSKKSLLNLLVLVNIAFIVLTSGEQTFHGWYDYMLYPLLILNLGQIWQQMVKQGDYLLTALFWILLLPVVRWVLKLNFNLAEMNTLIFRLLIVLGFLPLGWQVINQKKLAKISLVMITIVLLLAATAVSWQMQMVDYWEVDSYFLYR